MAISAQIIAFLQWCLHDFWRLIGAVLLLRAAFSWRLFFVDLRRTEKSAPKKEAA